MKGGASSAALFGETIRNTFGWNVMKPSVIGNDIWDRIYQVYVKDEFNLGIHRFFEAENPGCVAGDYSSDVRNSTERILESNGGTIEGNIRLACPVYQ